VSAAAARATAALALAAALDADRLAATLVEVDSAGTASAAIAGGATVVTFGAATDLSAKLAALRALAAAGALRGVTAIDLSVPDRPAVSTGPSPAASPTTLAPAAGGGARAGTGTGATGAASAPSGSPGTATGVSVP
jgi:hypothetical protein